MIFASLALLSGMVLLSAAAPWFSPPGRVTHSVNVSNAAAAPSPPGRVTHFVNVSNATAGLIYDPPYITAKPGDTVSFRFHPKNHTVTQSTFDAPCSPLHGEINTGFIPVTLGTQYDELPTREFTVEDKMPVWIYCAQAANTPESHCGKGMVFAVNPGPDGSAHSFDHFKKKALEIGKELAAGY